METSRSLFGRSALVLLLCLAGALVQGCGSKPTRLEAKVIASEDVNQDAVGRALPIVVRVYELKATGGFQGADFYSLYDNESATLGGDLLAREELNLRPGQQYHIDRAAAAEAQFIGVLAAFSQIDSATWRATHPLSPGKVNKVEIKLGPNAVSIQ